MDSYDTAFAQAFGVPPEAKPGWLNFPFEWGTPESHQVQNAIWAVEAQMWGGYIGTLKGERIAGSLLEFGVAGGAGLKQLFIAKILLDYEGVMFGFDSFEGLPAPSEDDPPYWEEGQFAITQEAAMAAANPWGRPDLRLVKGWFNETLADPVLAAEIGQVAFARIDCDLYQSAVDCLTFLEDRLLDGSFLVFDDWTDDRSTGETKAFFEFAARTRDRYVFEPLARISVGGMHVRVRHRGR